MRLALATAAVASTLGALAWPAIQGDARVAPVRQAKVEGKGVKWWAHRARENKRDYRHQRKRVGRLTDALSARVSLSGGLADAFLCVHAYEGSWTANTGNGFYGGLQMNHDFMASYGREFLAAYGTADRWPPFVQIAVAMRAHLSGRGFGPWPSTRRMCGV